MARLKAKLWAVVLIGLTAGALQAQSVKEKELMERQDKLEAQIRAMEERLDKRYELMPHAVLWATSDFQLFRTAVPELHTKRLSWVILFEGAEVLDRSAANEWKFNPFSVLERKPGTYVAYLATWADGAYRPISNVVTINVKEAVKGAKPPTTKPGTGRLPLRSSSVLQERIEKLEERMAEYRLLEVQQKELQPPLTIWRAENGTVHRSAGTDEIERNITWNVSGANSLSRNARGETSLSTVGGKPGTYRIFLTATGTTPLSEVLEFSTQGRQLPVSEDADNDGL